MAKKAATSHMNQTERVAGTIFFIVYLLVLPLLANKLFGIVEVLLDTKISVNSIKVQLEPCFCT